MSRPTVSDRYWGERIERERQRERERRAAWMDWWRHHAARCRACGAFRVVDDGGGPIVVQVAPLPPGVPEPPRVAGCEPCHGDRVAGSPTPPRAEVAKKSNV